ncbi:peroxidase [Eupeodes corollae]|uniref:peroxidase n=1 Tax=Eupeodes corollae TaxID=290404 RepID=UPI002491A28A|nr:peroxidase [Eupeodes corollae]
MAISTALVLLLMQSILSAHAVKVSTADYNVIHENPSNDFTGYTIQQPELFHARGYPRPLPPPASHFEVSSQPPNPFAAFASPYGPTFPMPGSAACGTAPPACGELPYRTLDGSCNNLGNPQLGIANSKYGRLLSPKYSDGIQQPTRSVTGEPLPNARLVSLVVFGELDVPDPDFTLVNMQWGQIITHDMSMQAGGTQSKKHTISCCTPEGRLVGKGVAHKTCFPIVIPPHDPAHSQVGTECMEFVRTLTDRDINCNYNGGAAEQLTAVTSFMDLSLIYGNSIEQNRVIREFQGGRMIVEERNGGQWLPRTPNVTTDCDVQDANEVCYLAGDIRVNQNPGLTILHTVLIREHNRIAGELSKLNPHWSDRVLFQESRKINIGQFQQISYYEWLPIFLGWENMLKNRLIYKAPAGSHVNDYDPSIDPAVLNEHATAAFRYFHSQIEGRLDLISELRSVLGSLRLSDWFNRPGIIEVGDNFDSLTRGLGTQPEELTDINFDREIKHFLFRRNMPFGGDLRAIDIQRNRDHGLASYNDMREFCGLKRANSWKDFTDLIDNDVVDKMQNLYATPDDVDLTVGGSLESHVAGALAGPTFLCILTEQFFRTRVGDRYFFEGGDRITGFTKEQLEEIRKASMARLMCDNGNHITSMQPSAFVTVSKANPIIPCEEIPAVDLSKWIDRSSHGSNGYSHPQPGYYGPHLKK